MRRAVLLAVLLAVTTAACARSGDRLGAGADVDLCAGWVALDGFDEPNLADREATLRWAEGAIRVIDRIDLRRELGRDDERAPRAIGEHLRTARESLDDFVRTLHDDRDVGAAFEQFSASAFAPSTDAIGTYVRSTC